MPGPGVPPQDLSDKQLTSWSNTSPRSGGCLKSRSVDHLAVPAPAFQLLPALLDPREPDPVSWTSGGPNQAAMRVSC